MVVSADCYCFTDQPHSKPPNMYFAPNWAISSEVDPQRVRFQTFLLIILSHFCLACNYDILEQEWVTALYIPKSAPPRGGVWGKEAWMRWSVVAKILNRLPVRIHHQCFQRKLASFWLVKLTLFWGRDVREGFKKSKWKFLMPFAIRGGVSRGSRLPLSYFEKWFF